MFFTIVIINLEDNVDPNVSHAVLRKHISLDFVFIPANQTLLVTVKVGN